MESGFYFGRATAYGSCGEKLVEILEKHRNSSFGKFKVEQLYLVYNNWYQGEKFVKELHKFKLI